MSEHESPRHDEESRERAAEADETLPPGAMPGGPEYADDEAVDDEGAPAH